MSVETKARDLFIVDNSISGWTGLRYLQEWTELAKSFDIATGYLEIGSLLKLDGRWQKLDRIRILMGSEMTQRTRAAMLEATRTRALSELDGSLERNKDLNPLLSGVPAILEAMRTGRIECRVYDKDKFHAKAYITHARMEIIGAQALVGSSNFTEPGLTQNIELNVQIQNAREVAQLQDWFESHWNDGKDVTEDVVRTIERHTHLHSPFEVYAKSLQEWFKGHELTANEWDQGRSKMFPRLDQYQREAYWALVKIARQHRGAFLCDGVGLGKTFVGLTLIERMILHEGKRVVLFAPKAAREGVWDRHLRTFLPHVGGVGGGGDFSNLAVFNHTDLGRKGDFPERFRRITELADVVIIDEAHHFRNPGRQGSDDGAVEPSRYHRLRELLADTGRPKSVFMLTATPINNGLSDFRHLIELFSGRDESYFAATLGINNLQAHFNQMEKTLRQRIGGEATNAAEHVEEAGDVLFRDQIFRHLVVQRSRSYARESQIRQTGKAAVFPERKSPQVADYSIRKTYGRLLEVFERAFARKSPLFTLAMYYPLAWYRGPDTTINPIEENRQRQVVGLIRTNFLKRFESSVAAFDLSCHRLLQKLLAFLEVHSKSDAERKRLEKWRDRHADSLGFARKFKTELWGDEDDESEDEDILPPELLESIDPLGRDMYDVPEMMSETYQDLDQIMQFLDEAKRFEAKQDDKLQKLIRLLKSRDLTGQKVLVFSEFADTARYLRQELAKAGISGVDQVDSATKRNRADVIERFSPYYNGSSSGDLAAAGRDEITVLVSTDVLSEGLNLQDATRMINYDIHWNPVRLMQRIGRVDRRMDPAIEEQIVRDHPELTASRGRVSFWNFLPPDELNELLTLYTKVTQKTLLISRTLGIEGKKLLRPDDDYEALKEFNHAYEGERTSVEDMHLEYQRLLQEHPGLEGRLARLPGSVFSGRRKPPGGSRGVFFCYALPALDTAKGEFTEEAGTVRWYLYDLDAETIIEDPARIIECIRSEPATPRESVAEAESLLDLRRKVEKHIKNSYLKRLNAPLGVGPKLRCWMELNAGSAS